MCEYGFTENIDYMSFSVNSEKPTGGRPRQDHQLTIEMTKEMLRLKNILMNS